MLAGLIQEKLLRKTSMSASNGYGTEGLSITKRKMGFGFSGEEREYE
jgi:hypothetical protein